MDYARLKTETESLKLKVGVLETNYSGISSDVTKLGTDFNNNKTRDDEERKDNNKKFEELYNSRNKTNDVLVELSTTVKMFGTSMEQQFNSLEKKIDELRAERKGQ